MVEIFKPFLENLQRASTWVDYRASNFPPTSSVVEEFTRISCKFGFTMSRVKTEDRAMPMSPTKCKC
jgi:hypothetical protein